MRTTEYLGTLVPAASVACHDCMYVGRNGQREHPITPYSLTTRFIQYISQLRQPPCRESCTTINSDVLTISTKNLKGQQPEPGLSQNKSTLTWKTYTYFPAAEHRKTATPAMSSASPSLPKGLSLLSSSMPPRLLIKPWASLEGKKPGAMTLDVMFRGPSSTARFLPRCFTHPLSAKTSRPHYTKERQGDYWPDLHGRRPWRSNT